MVSKVAVIALVGILAVPILLGYGLNLSEVAVTEYTPDGESVNVTELLQTGTAYNTALADAYKLNTNFEDHIQTMPIYEKVSSTKTSFEQYQRAVILNPGEYIYYPWAWMTGDFFAYIGPGYNVRFVDLGGGGTIEHHVVNDVMMVHYWHDDNIVEYDYSFGTNFFRPEDRNSTWAFFGNTGATPVTIHISGMIDPSIIPPKVYADFSAGYHFENIGANRWVNLLLPDLTRSTLMTVDLDSITAADYSINYNMGSVKLTLQKSTVDGVVSWTSTQWLNSYSPPLNVVDLYYNPSGSNVYQIIVNSSIDHTAIENGLETMTVNWHSELRYVGNWPAIIGAANYYISYGYDHQSHSLATDNYFYRITIGNGSSGLATTPIMRLDSAEFRAFAYPIISDQTYNPSDFKSNPTTTIAVSKAGSSIEFAGNTYTVDNSGNITLGTHKVSVNGLKMESVPVAAGYENKINGSVISVSADPSTIKFNGQWGASVTTIGNTATVRNVTQWTPGQFAWDGIDDNFLIVGLITCLGVFIGLGIYARSHRMSIWPLLLVCGGAAALFIFMI